jgi:hypothetical protein
MNRFASFLNALNKLSNFSLDTASLLGVLYIQYSQHIFLLTFVRKIVGLIRTSVSLSRRGLFSRVSVYPGPINIMM